MKPRPLPVAPEGVTHVGDEGGQHSFLSVLSLGDSSAVVPLRPTLRDAGAGDLPAGAKGGGSQDPRRGGWGMALPQILPLVEIGGEKGLPVVPPRLPREETEEGADPEGAGIDGAMRAGLHGFSHRSRPRSDSRSSRSRAASARATRRPSSVAM